MLKSRLSTSAIVLSAALAVCSAAEKPGPDRALSRTPAPVQKTVHEQIGGGKLISLERNVDDGEVSFDVEMTRDGKTRAFTVAADGELVSIQVFLAELPAAVQKTIQAQVGKGTLGEIDKSTEAGETDYDVELTRDGKTRNLTVGADGELLAEEAFFLELPPAAQRAIQSRIANAKLTDIEKTVDDGETTYEVEIDRAGLTRSFTVNTNGDVPEEQVFLSELPDKLQSAIQAKTAGGKPGEINKITDDGDVSYEVEMIQAGKTRTLTFDSDGNLSSEEEEISLSDAPEPVRKEIQSLAGGGKIAGLSRVTAGKEISFDVDLSQGGKESSFTIAADGKLVPQNGN
jgi:uncharacterized membrane protein YkoI